MYSRNTVDPQTNGGDPYHLYIKLFEIWYFFELNLMYTVKCLIGGDLFTYVMYKTGFSIQRKKLN